MKNKGFIVVFSGLLALASCGGGAQKKAEVETPPVEEVKPEVRDTFPSDKWMEENKQKEGVVEADGIQYKVLQEGTGDKPNKRKRVKMNFEVRLTNGKLVESHWGKDVMELPVANVIPGLQNALTLMPEGSTWEIYIPWQLGYGAEGSKNIPPYSALIFKVKLIEVVKLK
jgi:FKBP-type peptidyl-prolyl cis-trans isomerase FklB